MGSGSSPSPVEFSSLHHFYKLSHSWLLGMSATPAFYSPTCLFTVLWGISLPPLQRSGCPTLFATCLYCCYCLLLSFSFFPLVGVGLSRGLCWSGPGLSRSTAYHLAHLVVHVLSGRQRLAAIQGPSWFLRLTWSGDSLHRLEVWRGQSFTSSQWFCL
jgi:hypothetical protein